MVVGLNRGSSLWGEHFSREN